MQLSALVREVPFSATLALDALAKARAAAGADVVNMAVGEPDFPAPAAAVRAARERLESGDVRYTAAAGELPLRRAIAAYLERTRGVPYTPDEVVVCQGAKQALSGVFAAIAGPGDEVVVPLPAWGSFLAIVRLAGATPVTVPPRADGSPDVEGVVAAMTERTVAVLLNSPSNPTGYVWTSDEVERVASEVVARDLWLVCDEIYRRLVHEGDPGPCPPVLGPEVRARTVLVDGASKTYAMTGYRIGFAAGPEELVSAVARLHSQLTGSPNAVSQAAYRACLEEEPPEVAEMARELAGRRELVLAGLAELDLPCPRPRGAFYAFPDVRAHLAGADTDAFCKELLEAENVVLVPGSAFEAEGFVRLSYALPRERLDEALARLGRFLATRR